MRALRLSLLLQLRLTISCKHSSGSISFSHRLYLILYANITTMKHTSITVRLVFFLLLVYNISCSSCSSYRVATHAQGSTDNSSVNSTRAYSLLWGLLNHPQVIRTPVCDSLGVNGVAEVIVKKRVDDALLTIITLGIYSPAHITWKCSKPCQQSQSL
jgi:hypothetical protein